MLSTSFLLPSVPPSYSVTHSSRGGGQKVPSTFTPKYSPAPSAAPATPSKSFSPSVDYQTYPRRCKFSSVSLKDKFRQQISVGDAHTVIWGTQ